MGVLCIRNDIAGIRVIENQLDTIGRIVWVAGDEGCSGLQDTIHREHHPAGTRQQHGNPVTRSDTTFDKGVGYAVGCCIELSIREGCIAGYQCQAVGMLSGLLFHALMQEEHGDIVTTFFMHRFYRLALAFAHDGDAAQRRIGCVDEMRGNSGNALRQTFHHLLTIESIIILYNHRGCWVRGEW